MYMFVGGITAARFGVHLFDLCVIQLFQEGVRMPKNQFLICIISKCIPKSWRLVQVEEEKRGVFSGVETSICYGMDLIKFVLVCCTPVNWGNPLHV